MPGIAAVNAVNIRMFYIAIENSRTRFNMVKRIEWGEYHNQNCRKPKFIVAFSNQVKYLIL